MTAVRLYSTLPLALCLFAASVASAAPRKAKSVPLPPPQEGLFAIELEFKNAEIYRGDGGKNDEFSKASIEKVGEWAELMKSICRKRKDCSVRKVLDWRSYEEAFTQVAYYKVTFKDGFSFNINHDPGTLEVQTSPIRPSEITKAKEKVKIIFETAKQIGLKPPNAETHIHTGIEATFGDNVMAFRNQAVDMANHQEFSWLFTDGAISNATPMSSLPAQGGEDRLLRFAQIVDEVDSGKITDSREFAKSIRKKVYDVTLMTDLHEDDWESKYQLYNVDKVRNKDMKWDEPLPKSRWTSEIRAIYHPKNEDEWADWMELMAKRSEFLKQKGKPVVLRRFKPEADWEYAVGNFKLFVEESFGDSSGASWERFSGYLPKNLQDLKPKDMPPTSFWGETYTASKCLQRNLASLFADIY